MTEHYAECRKLILESINYEWISSSDLIEKINKPTHKFIGVRILQQLSYLVQKGYVERENLDNKNGHGQRYRKKVRP